ncbi:hypothetical protein LDENG_00297540 [Lucifuga dentata]|nr:hypothetical protein LDENG_00297540 [Lucifuga dentata]
MGHSWRRSSGPLHRLAIVFGLCSICQWKIQEGRIVALRLVQDKVERHFCRHKGNVSVF